ncbi:conserved hypothetical protein [Hyphomicrobiales bacterium]|nr:conserved hypothetical protein [Hyphomicrobiales bacterium]
MSRTKRAPAIPRSGLWALSRPVASRLAGGAAAIALVMGTTFVVTPASAQNAPLELPQQGQSLAKPGKTKPARPARKAKSQSSGRVEGRSVQEFRQPSYDDLARQGADEGGTSIRPSFRGGRPALNMGF